MKHVSCVSWFHASHVSHVSHAICLSAPVFQLLVVNVIFECHVFVSAVFPIVGPNRVHDLFGLTATFLTGEFRFKSSP